ncbi:SPFH domain-containing protein [Luteibaculum oceani]|uniref:SPFH domain-containing protein n=1 Tax=Luteibaculum oceani TaxID=1294296 RepID=A0A5C6UYN1_9FLAO|nr:SPFH domain-containing protein [Luteibaculum oceani]TXC78522.1 SPFH domain-containing protein [Luteibaculum oceani]
MLEKEIKPKSGLLGIAVILCLLIIPVLVFGASGGNEKSFLWYLLCLPLALISINGFAIINPNGSAVLTFFGKYVGTIRQNGFFFYNPLYKSKKISLRARNFDSERVKVNDLLGNPILISVILVWRVRETFKAAFEVDNYENFVRVQSDAAVRKLAGKYAYDNFDDDEKEITLRSGMDEVNESLEEELSERLAIAGIEVLEARIGYLAYAEEIAQSMLKRQQATAIVAARLKIVEGAVGMVEMALDQLSKKELVQLDEEKRAAMVSNLMVVLCGDKDATPVVNTGTLYK